MSEAIFIGSFDPWHNGHEDRIKNALKIFDKVYVVVADNPTKKNYWFNQVERTMLVKKCVEKFGTRVVVKAAGTKMIQDICHEEKIYNVFRGVKSGRTVEEEIRLQIVTNYMAKEEYGEEIFFVYDITSEEDFRGSSIIKTLAINGKDFSSLVPNIIIKEISERAMEICIKK